MMYEKVNLISSRRTPDTQTFTQWGLQEYFLHIEQQDKINRPTPARNWITQKSSQAIKVPGTPGYLQVHVHNYEDMFGPLRKYLRIQNWYFSRISFDYLALITLSKFKFLHVYTLFNVMLRWLSIMCRKINTKGTSLSNH